MMDRLSSIMGRIFAFLLSPPVVATIDVLALLFAFVPVLYFTSRILFGDASKAQQLIQSRGTLARFTTLCIIEVLLQSLKIPIVMKVLGGIFVILAAIFFLLGDPT